MNKDWIRKYRSKERRMGWDFVSWMKLDKVGNLFNEKRKEKEKKDYGMILYFLGLGIGI